jgi:polysaccharide pyruvyl transferase WcaK-like protein
MVESYDWVRALRTARRTDMFVMSGTGMLSDTGEGVFGLPYEIFKWSLAAKACGRRLLFVSVGVESIRHPLARCFIRTALRVADYRCYRDVQSRDRLRTLGFAVDADPVHPDLAFSLPESLTEVPQRPAAGRPTVAVGLYDYLGRGRGGVAEAGAYRDYVAKICAFVVWLLDHAYRVRLIIGDLSYVVAPGDRLVDRPATSVEQLLRHLSEVDLVVATRFHNVLLGLLLGKPAISISYHAKNDALMAEMGLARYCQPIAQLDLERLITQFRELEARATQLRPGILDKARSYRDELERQYRRIFADA